MTWLTSDHFGRNNKEAITVQSCNIVLLNSFCFSFRGSVQFVGKDYVQDFYKKQ